MVILPKCILLKYTESWDYKTKREATSFLNAVTSFEFIVSFIELRRLFHPLAGIINCLKERGVGIIEVYVDVSSAIKFIKSTRKNIAKEFSVMFEQAERVAAKVGTQPSITHIAKKQVN